MSQQAVFWVKFLLILLLVIVVEEYYFNGITTYVGVVSCDQQKTRGEEDASDAVEKNVTKSFDPMVPRTSEIAILVVVREARQWNNYVLAQSSVACYCKIFGYRFIQVAIDSEEKLKAKCPQKDFMFQRHCVSISILQDHPEIKYLLFLDADMGIINPLHLIENYIDRRYDLIFYERIFNFEIMAGSYLVRNTPYALGFLQDWVNFETQLPKSFHGTDNAAIHQIFVNRFAPNDNRSTICRDIWSRSKNWQGVWNYVGCARSILNGQLAFDRVKILSKESHSAWSRDCWLFSSEWCPRDFIFHAWKTSTQNKGVFAGWVSPFLPNTTFPLSECTWYGKGFDNWRYNESFIRDNADIDARIRSKAEDIRGYYTKYIEKLWG